MTADPSPVPPPPPARRRWRGAVLTLLLIAAMVAGAVYLVQRAQTPPAAGPSAGAPRGPGGGFGGGGGVTVGATRAVQGTLPVLIDALGTVTPPMAAALVPQVSGVLTQVLFTEGQKVAKGQVLAHIDARPYEQTLAQARGQRAKDEAQLAAAHLTLGRYQRLWEQDSIARQDVDTQAALVKQLEGVVESDRASERAAELNVGFTTLRAPIDGVIGLRAVDPGNLVTPESGVLATIVRSDKMYVLFPVTQAQLLEARKDGSTPENLKVRARLADNSFVKDLGVIDFLDVTVDSRTDGQIVRALFPNPDNVLTDGQTVRVSIERKDPPTVDAIPVSAVSTDQAGPYVFVVGPDDTVEQRRVQLGEGREGFVVVKDGLKTGDLVIVQGIQKVRPGVKVSAKLATDASGSNNGETK